jgi:urea transport system ATP-binding protein
MLTRRYNVNATGSANKAVGNKILTTENLTVTFGGFTALNNLNFSMNAGELRVVIGPNGAGKRRFWM